MMPRRRPSDPPLTARGSLRWAVVEPMLAGLRPRTVLELGCGVGAVGARIARHADYTGVEPDLGTSQIAATRVEPRGGRVLHGDAGILLWGTTYDVVCAFEVLEHIEDDAAALAAWLKHLRHGGHVVVSVPEDPERFGPSDVQVGHFRRYTEESLRGLLQGAGLEVVQLVHYGWPLGYLLEAVSHRAATRALAAEAAEAGGEPGAADGMDDEPGRRAVGSGGWLQPGAVAGAVLKLGVTPFTSIQGRRSDRGTGLIALAQRP
jgi:SAM-dependent methyltransferase